jgi:hypothetical protein
MGGGQGEGTGRPHGEREWIKDEEEEEMEGRKEDDGLVLDILH